MNVESKPDRTAVLVVLHHDGWVEVFGEKTTDVHLAVMPAMESPEGQIAAEEYLELQLPYRHQQVYYPSNRRAADLVRTIKPSDIERTQWELELIRTVKNAGNTETRRRRQSPAIRKANAHAIRHRVKQQRTAT